jgi:hypothetical protein
MVLNLFGVIILGSLSLTNPAVERYWVVYALVLVCVINVGIQRTLSQKDT